MKVDEVMKRDVTSVSPRDTIQCAARRMFEHNVGFVPVMLGGKVLGTLTDRDIVLRAVAAGHGTGTAVNDVMTRDVVCCRMGDDLRRAEELMAEHQISRLVVLDEAGKLRGVLSLSDIAQNESSDRASWMLREITLREAKAA
jgi:CBS domain-containing protein